MASTLPTLETVLTYKNPRVLKRFQQLQPEHKDRAEEIFEDLLRYLWLCRKHEWEKDLSPTSPELDFICVMHEEMRIVDEMWHAFIIFTKDYEEFCRTYFGSFIHHIPNVVEDEAVVTDDFEGQTRKFLTFVYDQLGEETVCRWFQEHL